MRDEMEKEGAAAPAKPDNKCAAPRPPAHATPTRAGLRTAAWAGSGAVPACPWRGAESFVRTGTVC